MLKNGEIYEDQNGTLLLCKDPDFWDLSARVHFCCMCDARGDHVVAERNSSGYIKSGLRDQVRFWKNAYFILFEGGES